VLFPVARHLARTVAGRNSLALDLTVDDRRSLHNLRIAEKANRLGRAVTPQRRNRRWPKLARPPPTHSHTQARTPRWGRSSATVAPGKSPIDGAAFLPDAVIDRCRGDGSSAMYPAAAALTEG
jgi:hypothetical protein